MTDHSNDRLMLAALSEFWLHTPDMAFIKDVDGVYLRASQPFAEMVGCASPDGLIGKTDFDIFDDQELAARYVDDDRKLLQSGVPLENYIEPITTRDGRPRYALTSKRILRDENGAPVGIFGMGRDITAQYEAQQTYENEMRSVFTLPQDALVVVVFDITSWRIIDTRYRDGAERVVLRAATVDELIHNAAASVAEDEQVRAVFSGMSQKTLEEAYRNGARSRSLEYLRRLPDGTTRWVRDDVRFLLDPVNGNLALIAVLYDIDESKRAYSELLRAAKLDPMTELLNRGAMMQQISGYLSGEGARGSHALFMIDLDNFKQVNDSFGHQYGDTVLKDAAAAIRSVFRASDIIGRMGGDEFMALMKDAATESIVRAKADDLISALQFSARNSGCAMELTSSVGVTMFRAGACTLETLYDEADAALYQSKRSGKNRYSIVLSTHANVDAPSYPALESVGTVHLRTLLEYMDGGVILAEIGGQDDIRITYVSPSIFRTFGRTQENGGKTGNDLLSVVYPEDLPALRAAVFQIAQSNEILEHSFRVNGKNGLEWLHIRAKSIPGSTDGVQRIVSVITDVSALKETEEHLREAEVRYRTAIEQTDAMLWEVDIASRTMSLTGSGWEKFGFHTYVFPNAPESYFPASPMDRGSVAEYRRMFDDLYHGKDSDNYFFKSYTTANEEIWVRANFKLLTNADGTPRCALGVTVPVPNINAEMRRFEQELNFAEIVRDSLLGYVHANLSQNVLEYSNMAGDPRYDRFRQIDYDTYHDRACELLVPEEERAAFSQTTRREALLERFREGENWNFFDYQRIGTDGVRRWTSLFVKLMRHPISGDIYLFAYFRDNDMRRRWELALNAPLERNSSLLLYTRDSMRTLCRYILSVCPGNELVAVSVIELTGIDAGPHTVGELLFTFGRLCRIVIGGDVLIGQVADNRVALLRVGAGGTERQRERVSATMALLKELLRQAHPSANVSIVCGFAVERAQETSYGQLLRKAQLACQSAAKTFTESAVAYADTGVELSGEKDVSDLAERYRALELRYQQQANLLRLSENDELTGLLSKSAFYRRARELINSDPATRYVIVRFDINRFKVYNDVRGIAAGDLLLRDIADKMTEHGRSDTLCARLEADHFVLLTPDDPEAIKRSRVRLAKWLANYSQEFRLSSTIGVYTVIDPGVDVSLMCDRALLALRAAKSGFETRMLYYDEKLRDHLIDEQELMDSMQDALESDQFELYFQPQINYEDGSLVGAEALARWNHPTRGVLTPGAFIPLFEKNGLITRLDEYIWDRCCRYIRDWTDLFPQAHNLAVSVSVNVSRLDIYNIRLCETLKKLVDQYNLPPSALKLEITESAYMENPQQLINTVHELQTAGFIVEMDDFGSGYSSLNTLKDVAVDVLKLDLKFLSECADRARGGNILSSVIRMAHWLKLPVIAEGVETKEQADYLKSLNCVYMQGYYFSKPMPAAQFEKMLHESRIGKPGRYSGVDLEGVAAFWDASAQTTLLFNSFVGGAAIVEYENGCVSVLRANDRFYVELLTTREEYREKQTHTLDRFDGENRAVFLSLLDEAVRTGDETECEVQSLPQRAGGQPYWTHNRARLLARNSETNLVYVAVENITERKRLERERDAESERNRLIMQGTGTGFFDYDYAGDVLVCQLCLPGEGVVKRTFSHCSDSAPQSARIAPEQIRKLQSIMREGRNAHVDGEVEFLADLTDTGVRWYRARYASVEDGGGNVYRLVGQMDDIQSLKDRAALAEAIGHRLNATVNTQTYDEVIVNQIFSLFYESADIAGAIETTLSLLGEYFDLSRAYIFEDEAAHTCASNTFEWCAPGVAPQKALLQGVPYDQMGGRTAYLARFDQSGAFFCPDVGLLSEQERAVLEPQGIYSMLQYAIRDGGVFTGMVGFDECRENRCWSDTQAGTLMFVSRIIGMFLRKLRQSDNAAFSADFRAALDDNATYIYVINPDTHEILYCNKAIRDYTETNHIGKTCYREFIGRETPCRQCPVRSLHSAHAPHIAEVARADGMLLLSQASPLRWNGHDMAMLSCIDITESKKAERALITEKQKTDLALVATRLTLWTWDIRQNTFTISNSAGGRYRTGEVIEGAYRAVLSDGLVMQESAADYLALHKRILSGAETASAFIRYRLGAADSPVEWMKVSYTVVSVADGKPAMAIAIGQDVTAQKQAEARYRQEAEYRRTLGSEYILTLRINATRDLVEDVQSSELPDISIVPGTDCRALVSRAVDAILDAREGERFQASFAADSLLAARARGETELRSNYLGTKPGGGRRFLETDVKLAERPGDGDVIAFVDVRDRTAEWLIQSIMDKIIDTSYDYVAYIDAETNRFQMFASDADVRAMLPAEGEDFEKAFAETLCRQATAGDADRLVREASLARVIERLAGQEEYVCTYRSTPETGGRMRQLAFRALSPDRRQLMLTRQDVTELVEAEYRNSEQLAAALTEAEEANAAKSAFLSQISHDIRTPLNAVIGLTALALGREGLPEDVAGYLAMIDRSGRFLRGLISDILDLSKIEKGVVELHPERYEYAEFLGAIEATFMPLCDQKRITFRLDDDPQPLALLADPVRFQQIFFNVLSNAVRFTPAGGTVRFAAENRSVHDGVFRCDYRISDTGCGIGAEFLSHVYEPFSRERRGDAAQEEGGGLGLSIAKRLIELMGGTIEIQSAPNAGTEVRIHLELPVDPTPPDERTPQKQTPPEGSLAGAHVLLAEDVPINATIVRRLLERAGATVDCAENGRIALERFAASACGSFDAVLLDISMPVMDGLAAARGIRALERADAAGVPIIALSANAFEEDRTLSREAGMDAHLSKPVDTRLLIETIRTLMDARQERRATR